MTTRFQESLSVSHFDPNKWTEVRSPTVEGPFFIEPSDISQGPLWDCFGNSETESSASWLLRMFREYGGWFAFTYEEIDAIYRKKFNDGFTFNRLVNHDYSFSIRDGNVRAGGGWVVKGEDGKYRVTINFILRCYEARAKEELRTAKAANEHK